jgi:serine/threonine protein phosphatase PrpC
MRAISLLGRHWPELGPLALVELDDGGALALSRGAQPKSYAHTDPNEDAALMVRLPAGVLLAVADGHNGLEAAELAIVRAQAGADFLLAATGADFRVRICELLDDVRARLTRGSRSRATLVLAALHADRVELASFGDAYAFRSGSPTPLIPPNAILVGSDHSPRDIEPARWYRSCERAPGERVALVSDGVINFMPDPSEIPGLLAAATGDLACVRTIALAALRGGAGDNVAVAAFAGAIGL